MTEVPAYIVGKGSEVVHDGKQWRVRDFENGLATLVRRGSDPVRVDLSELVLEQPQELRTASARMMKYTQTFKTYEQLGEATRENAESRSLEVLEVLTGYKSGSPTSALAHEPRPEYDTSTTTLTERQGAKAAELGVAARTVRWWCDNYRRGGEVGLAHQKLLGARKTFHSIDPRIPAKMQAIIDRAVKGTRPVAGKVIEAVLEDIPEELHPSQATMYRLYKRLQSGTGLQGAIAKTRASMNARPTVEKTLRVVTRPGEIVQLDTTVLDMFCVDPDGGEPYRPELTVAIDQFTRCILATIIAKTTSAEHVLSLVGQIINPQPIDPDMDHKPVWPYHGIPFQIEYTAHTDADVAADDVDPAEMDFGPIVVIDTIVIDNGKIYTGKELKRLAATVGFSLEPTAPGCGFTKGHIERFFGTGSRGALSRMRGYTGGGLESTLGDPAKDAYYTPAEVLDYLRLWVATDYHVAPQRDLVAPGTEFRERSPLEMYQIGLETSGFVRAPIDVDLHLHVLPAESRKITHDVIRINNRKYSGPSLKQFRNRQSTLPGGKWLVHWDPADLDVVYVQDDNHHFHEVQCTEKTKAGAGMPMSDVVRRLVDEQRRKTKKLAANRKNARKALSKFNQFSDHVEYPHDAERTLAKSKARPADLKAAAAIQQAAGEAAITTTQIVFAAASSDELPSFLQHLSAFPSGNGGSHDCG
ncbi:Mu transposase C-terminal domain-containing protein [Frondihabitans australicus]|uniref:Mu transposase-like protein n=1 Tax=Frondihabitans australicus TaxID=386892 RepID=A0A495IL88_9MICO|nr:Mu transposase C-terminal domain-containing protein [Frondihabitans australicus]RKR75895.1 Mu transposase-like protein [Frondihabitans australicus]